MKRSIAESLVRLLAARAPKDVADLCLDFVLGASHAPAGAIFKVQGGAPALYTSHGITQRGLDWIRDNWERLAETMRTRNEAIVYQEHSLAPVARGGMLAGAFYCQGAVIDEAAVIEVTDMVLDAIRSDEEAPHHDLALDSYLERTPADEIERRKLLLMFSRHEWNIARVAREYGVTRTTLYRRLDLLGVTQERVRELRLASRRRRTT